MFTTVYASLKEEGKKDLWRKLKTIAEDTMQTSWLVGGDLNDISECGGEARWCLNFSK